MNTQFQSLILASASKTRSQILLNAGIVFRVQVADIDEKEVKRKFNFKHPEELASELAYQKADKISRSCEDSLVIGADQILECDGVLFDKPTNKKEVVSHLKFLRGKTHRLVSAVCVIHNTEKYWEFTDSVKLTMRKLTDEFIQTYAAEAGTEIFSSVGGYRLENIGAQLFIRVEGDFFTVLGLPLLPLLEFLRSQKFLKT